jgi:hypothetical protein
MIDYDEIEKHLRAMGFSVSRCTRGLIWRTQEPNLFIRTESQDETLVVAIGQSHNNGDARYYVGVTTNHEYFGFNTSACAVRAQRFSNLADTRTRSRNMISNAGLRAWPFEAISRGVWADSTYIEPVDELTCNEACAVLMALLSDPNILRADVPSKRDEVALSLVLHIDPTWDGNGLSDVLKAALRPTT